MNTKPVIILEAPYNTQSMLHASSSDALDRCILQSVNCGRVYVSIGGVNSAHAAERIGQQREILSQGSRALGAGPPPEVIHRPSSVSSTPDVVRHSISMIKSWGDLNSETIVLYLQCRDQYLYLQENIKAMIAALEKYPAHPTMAFSALPYHSVVVEDNPNQLTHPGGSLQTYPPQGSRPRWEWDGSLMGWRAGYFLKDPLRQMWQGQLIPVPVKGEHGEVDSELADMRAALNELEQRVYAIESGVVYSPAEEVTAE